MAEATTTTRTLPRTPTTIARIARLDLRARQVVEGFISGMHKSPFFGQSRRVRPAPRVRPRRRHPPHRLEGLVQDRPLLHQAVRGRDQPARARSWSTSASRCTTARGGRLNKYDYACTAAACLAYLTAPAAGLRRADHVRRGRAAGRPAAQLSRRTSTPSSRRCTSASRARRPTS